MDTIKITNLVMDDICKNKSDVYEVAFYNTKNFEIEKLISLNIEQNNCNKYRINNLDWLRNQELMNLPDIIIMRPETKLTDEEQKLLINLNIKIYYVSDNILTDNNDFNRSINEIERIIYKSKTLKYLKLENKIIEDIEKKYEDKNISNDILTNKLIDEFLELLKNKDEITYKHVKNVSSYVDIFVDGLPDDKKLSDEEIIFLKRAALIHDIGKLIIPNQILKKRDKLDNNEYHSIKKHVAYNAYLFNNKLMQDFKDIALSHHERYDGLGYPNKLKGEQIPYFARIISVLDTFEALTGDRQYLNNKERNLYDILSILNENAGKQFDPNVVKYFIIGVIKNPEFQSNLTTEKKGILKCS